MCSVDRDGRAADRHGRAVVFLQAVIVVILFVQEGPLLLVFREFWQTRRRVGAIIDGFNKVEEALDLFAMSRCGGQEIENFLIEAVAYLITSHPGKHALVDF